MIDNHRTAALRKAGLTYKDVAKALDLSEGWVRRIFSKGCPSYYQAERLSRLLDCRMEIFL